MWLNLLMGSSFSSDLLLLIEEINIELIKEKEEKRKERTNSSSFMLNLKDNIIYFFDFQSMEKRNEEEEDLEQASQ